LTNHTTYDYEMIYKNAKVIFDTKNGFKALSEKDKIWLL